MGVGLGGQRGLGSRLGGRRRWAFPAGAMALGLLAPLAAAELLLGFHRYVGIAPLRMSVDEEHPVARYAPDRRFT